MGYQYFASSLPMQTFGANPPMSVAQFLEVCAEHLSASDYAALNALLCGGESRSAYVERWRAFDTQLRNAVARARASRSGGDASKWVRPHAGWSVALENAVQLAFQESDPMKRHRALAACRWQAASDLAGLDAFSAEYVFAYGLQLAIASDLAAASLQKGQQRIRAVATEAAK